MTRSIRARSLRARLPRAFRGPTVSATMLIATLGLFATQSVAQRAGAGKSDEFVLFGNFVLEVDGTIVPDAELFHSPGRQGVLVRSSKLSTPALVTPSGKKVELYAPEELVDEAPGRVRLLEGATPRSSSTFQLDERGPRWSMDGHEVRLVANPPLLGLHDRSEVLAHDAAYRFKSSQYVPIAEHMQALAAFDGAVRVKVYFGSWCSVCAERMPPILRVDADLEAAGASYLFEYYGLPRDYGDPEAQKEGISSVPTAVVWINGRRAGQINSSSWRYPAMALRNVVYGVRSQVEDRLEDAGVTTPPGEE